MAHHALALQLAERRQRLVDNFLQSALHVALELNIVNIDEVNVVNAQALHALVDAAGDALGRIVPGVAAVLSVAANFCAEEVFLAGNAPQRLSQHLLGLVVAIVGADVDEVDASLDGSLHGLDALVEFCVVEHAA